MKRLTILASLALLLTVAVAPAAKASRWQACGTVPGPVAHYDLKAKNAGCGTAKKVGGSGIGESSKASVPTSPAPHSAMGA